MSLRKPHQELIAGEPLITGLFQFLGAQYRAEHDATELQFSLDRQSNLPRDLKELVFEKEKDQRPLILLIEHCQFVDQLKFGEHYYIQFLKTFRKKE